MMMPDNDDATTSADCRDGDGQGDNDDGGGDDDDNTLPLILRNVNVVMTAILAVIMVVDGRVNSEVLLIVDDGADDSKCVPKKHIRPMAMMMLLRMMMMMTMMWLMMTVIVMKCWCWLCPSLVSGAARFADFGLAFADFQGTSSNANLSSRLFGTSV